MWSAETESRICALLGMAPAQCTLDRLTGDDHGDDVVLRAGCCRAGHHVATSLQDRDPVGEFIYIVDIVADPEDPDAVALQFLDQVR